MTQGYLSQAKITPIIANTGINISTVGSTSYSFGYIAVKSGLYSYDGSTSIDIFTMRTII